MFKDRPLPQPTDIDPDDRENNSSGNPGLNDVMGARLHRRHLLKGGIGALTAAAFGSVGLGRLRWRRQRRRHAPAPAPGPAGTVLGFAAVGKDLADQIVVPAGYTATVIYATGDSIDPAVADYRNDGSDDTFCAPQRRPSRRHALVRPRRRRRVARPRGDRSRAALHQPREHRRHRAVPASARPDQHRRAGARPEAEAIKEIEAHGVSVIELGRSRAASSAWSRSLDLQPPHHRRDADGLRRPGCAATRCSRPRYSPAGTGDPRHDQQLRQRLHALGHLPHLRGELGRLLPPRRRRRRAAHAPRN